MERLRCRPILRIRPTVNRPQRRLYMNLAIEEGEGKKEKGGGGDLSVGKRKWTDVDGVYQEP